MLGELPYAGDVVNPLRALAASGSTTTKSSQALFRAGRAWNLGDFEGLQLSAEFAESPCLHHLEAQSTHARSA